MSLRTGLAAVRRQLGEPAAACIAASRTTVGIEDGPGIWIDAREFDRLLAAGCGDQATGALRRRSAQRPRRRLGARGAPGTSRAGRGAARCARRGRRAGRRSRSGRGARSRAPGARPAVGGRCARPHRATRAHRRPRERRRRLSGGAREPAARAASRSLAGDPRPGAGDPGGAGCTDGPIAAEPPGGARSLAQDPLVGRHRQLARLHALWRRVQAGEPAMATVAGEAGGGKTRLISAFAVEARDGGAAVLAGRCYEDGATPYAPFTEALRQHATWLEPTSDWVAAELARLLPELPAEARAEGDPRDARHRLFEAVACHVARRRSPRAGRAGHGGPPLGRRLDPAAAGPRGAHGDVGPAARHRLVPTGRGHWTRC